jgi:hypothetical protein
VDVLVVASRGSDGDERRLYELLDEAADVEGVRSTWFSLQLFEPERLAQRREIVQGTCSRRHFVESGRFDRELLRAARQREELRGALITRRARSPGPMRRVNA